MSHTFEFKCVYCRLWNSQKYWFHCNLYQSYRSLLNSRLKNGNSVRDWFHLCTRGFFSVKLQNILMFMFPSRPSLSYCLFQISWTHRIYILTSKWLIAIYLPRQPLLLRDHLFGHKVSLVTNYYCRRED